MFSYYVFGIISSHVLFKGFSPILAKNEKRDVESLWITSSLYLIGASCSLEL